MRSRATIAYAFCLRARFAAFIVCKPWGESQPFDFIIAFKASKRFYRIQVKSTSYSRCHAYRLSVTRSRRYYTAREVDFVAAYVIPTNTWYIILGLVAEEKRR